MTPELITIGALVGLVGLEAYWINTLLNKLMSRNYHEYQVAQGVPATMLPQSRQQNVDTDPMEDLNHIGSPF